MTTPSETAVRERTRATGADLRAAFVAAASWLNTNAERINALNVFPVPDGDTGTNMSMTLQAAAAALDALPTDARVADVAHAAYEAAMLGARGNSGVILSQLLRGFASAVADKKALTPQAFAAALVEASKVAYSGVSKPVEGTILTVSRLAGDAALSAATSGKDLPGTLEQALQAATAAVAATPTQLEALRKAGVVDSGGEGYRVIIEAAWMWSTGRSLEQGAEESRPHSRALLDDFVDSGAEHSTYGFCTEFLLRDGDLPVDEVKLSMEEFGDSIIAVGDKSLLRVHVHTRRPGKVLEFAVDHGTLARVKVENMELQHQAFAAGGQGAAATQTEPVSSVGVVAVAAGDGFVKVFRSLGATVVHGGQTMNPSVQDVLAAVNSAGFKELVILPNNKNIILTARHVPELTPHTVRVIPTETVPQGIGALLAFNFQADLDTNIAAMEQAAHAVRTIEVTRAVRDAEVDGVQVLSGQFMGIYDGRVVLSAEAVEDALLGSLREASVESFEIVTLYYGAGATEAETHALAARIRDAHPGLAVEVVAGGQPHYPYVVSLE
jgi:DAK2 domain fusion protein YloV